MSDCSLNAFKVPEKPELKPCAHCGNDNPKIETYRTSQAGWMYAIKCTKCNSMTYWESDDLELSRELATDNWNTRYEPTCKLYVKENKYRCSSCHAIADPLMNYCESCGSRIIFDGERCVEVVD